MFPDTITNLAWTITFILLGALIGTSIIILTTSLLPRIIDKLTPNIDEDKEILRGNQAVAEYFGRISSAAIIGVSIVVAAAVLGGIIAGLHG